MLCILRLEEENIKEALQAANLQQQAQADAERFRQVSIGVNIKACVTHTPDHTAIHHAPAGHIGNIFVEYMRGFRIWVQELCAESHISSLQLRDASCILFRLQLHLLH